MLDPCSRSQVDMVDSSPFLDEGECALFGRFAGPADTDRYGAYRRPDRPRHPERFGGRLSADGSSGFRAEPGRYHLYAAWSCPWSQRVVLQIVANGLEEVIGVSYLDEDRDGRGWAFRAAEGADPVNGFRLLREAYEATDPGFDGHAGVPVLWDRITGRVVSNDVRQLGIDVAAEFAGYRAFGVDTYPVGYRDEIEAIDAWVGPAVNTGLGRAAGQGPDAGRARRALIAAFDRLDDLLADRRFLVADVLTEADFRLWVSVARYAVRANATGRLGPPLSAWPRLAGYAVRLAGLPAFRRTTRWSAFGAAGPRPSSAMASSAVGARA